MFVRRTWVDTNGTLANGEGHSDVLVKSWDLQAFACALLAAISMIARDASKF
jgi:hypothetical protein